LGAVPAAHLTAAACEFPTVLGLRSSEGLPLEVPDRVGAAAGKRFYVIFPVAGTGTAGFAGRRARMLPLKLPRQLTGSVLSSEGDARQGHAGERAEDDNPPQEHCIRSGHPPSLSHSALRSLIALMVTDR